jgi:hypothetical protein
MAWSLEDVPAWAYSWCYFFVFMGLSSLITGLSAIFLSKKLGLGLTILSLTTAIIQAATAFTLFWMCRRSLAGTANVTNGEWYAAQFSH